MLAVLQVLLASAAVAQAVSLPSSPNLSREQIGARIVAELARNQDSASVAVARQLIGGGDDYAPYAVPCPDNFDWIRPANVSYLAAFWLVVLMYQGLSQSEQDYLSQRQQYLGAINTQLTSNGLPTPSRTPVLGFALSGGGYRAMT
jgi:hypothetical protein